ncbi:MAG TPA: hypothetical protein VIM03_00895 [Thermoleophilaceae bacterium]
MPGVRAPASDTLVTLTYVDEGPAEVERVSEVELGLAFSELVVSWMGDRAPPAMRSRGGGSVSFVSNHHAGD